MKNSSIKNSSRFTQIMLNIVFVILSILVIIPFVLLVSASFSDEKDVIMNGYSLIPRIFSTAAYEYVLKNPTTIINSYKTTITFSLVAMVLATLLMSMIAYPLTKRDLKGRTALSFSISSAGTLSLDTYKGLEAAMCIAMSFAKVLNFSF